MFGKNGRTRAIALPALLWAELISLGAGTPGDEPVFSSSGGRPLDRGRVGTIVRMAAQLAGITSPVSPHWLRHAHASHALDHGAPIHLVQATLGHSSVATTSRYLHARPGESSARFLRLDSFSPESRDIDLPLRSTGVMNVVTAAHAAKGEQSEMTDQNTEDAATVQETASPKAKASKTARVAKQTRTVAPKKAKAGKKATPAKKTPKDAKPAKTSRAGSKTDKVLGLLKRPEGATLSQIMKATDWQAHSVRGFISGTLGKKMGLTVKSAKTEAGERVYSISD